MHVCMYVANGAVRDYTSLWQRLPNLGRDKHGWLWHEAQANTQRVDEAFLSATSLVPLWHHFVSIFTISIQHPASLAENAWTDSSKQTALSGSTASKLPTSVATLIQACYIIQACEIAVFVCLRIPSLGNHLRLLNADACSKKFCQDLIKLDFQKKNWPIRIRCK